MVRGRGGALPPERHAVPRAARAGRAHRDARRPPTGASRRRAQPRAARGRRCARGAAARAARRVPRRVVGAGAQSRSRAAQLALGDAPRARESAQAAVALDPRSAEAHELLGDALSELADFVGAREQYRAALELSPEPTLRRKLDTLFASATSASSARFRVQYDGGADEPLGLAVLRVLDGAWSEYSGTLGFSPAQPVTVVLQTATSFRDTTRAPEWAAAWNDGAIRVPVMGLTAPTAGLVRVLRHELAHSFVASRAGASAPTWLHEGIAQWLEGGDPAREDAAVAARARAGRLSRLEALETAFVGLSEKDAADAYADSLSAVAHLLRLRGTAGLRRLIDCWPRAAPPPRPCPPPCRSATASCSATGSSTSCARHAPRAAKR